LVGTGKQKGLESLSDEKRQVVPGVAPETETPTCRL